MSADPHPAERGSLWFDAGAHTKCESIGLLFLRIVPGGMLLVAHGWPKMAKYDQLVDTFSDPLGLGSGLSLIAAIAAEVICALLVIFGVVTRWAAFPIVFLLLVAAFVVHGSDPWAKKEFALVYAVPFLTLLFTGAGIFSVDHYLARRGLEAGTPGFDKTL